MSRPRAEIDITARICILYGDFSGRSDGYFRCFGSGSFPTQNGMNMAGVQLQRNNPPRMLATDDEAYGQERLSFMFPRCMGAKAAVEHSGVDTGFTRLMGCWNVRAIGQRRR